MRTRAVFIAAALCAALAGCEDKHQPSTAEPTPTSARGVTTTTTTTTGAAAATTTATVGIADQDIPVRADFEEEAERDITPANMEAELAKIEKELAAETATEGAAAPKR